MLAKVIEKELDENSLKAGEQRSGGREGGVAASRQGCI